MHCSHRSSFFLSSHRTDEAKKNWLHRQGRQVDMAGGQGPTCHASRPHHDAARCPTCPFHITDPWERSSKPSPALILSWFAPMVTMEWSWIHGSTVMDLEPSNRPLNLLIGQIFTRATFTTVFGSQPNHYDRKAVQSNAGRCPYHAAWCPSYLHHLISCL